MESPDAYRKQVLREEYLTQLVATAYSGREMRDRVALRLQNRQTTQLACK